MARHRSRLNAKQRQASSDIAEARRTTRIRCFVSTLDSSTDAPPILSNRQLPPLSVLLFFLLSSTSQRAYFYRGSFRGYRFISYIVPLQIPPWIIFGDVDFCWSRSLIDYCTLSDVVRYSLYSFRRRGTLLIVWKICGKAKLMIQKTNKYIPRRNKYILENILLNIFKFYILKYTIKVDKNLPFLIYFKICSLYIWWNRKKINL